MNGAVEMYESAVNRYISSGYPNNAIALCKKILRSAPGRNHVYLALARLMLQRGFIGEAKKNFIEYAQRMSDAGRFDEAFDALKSFADISPGNEDLRLMLAEQLRAAARDDEAREQIDKLISDTGGESGSKRASEILEKVRAVDPEYDVDNANPRSGRGKTDDLVFLDLNEEAAASAAESAPATVEPLDIQPTSLTADVEDVADVPGIEGLEQEATFDPSAAEDLATADLEPIDAADEPSATSETKTPEAEDMSFLTLDTTDQMGRPSVELDVPDLDLDDGVVDETPVVTESTALPTSDEKDDDFVILTSREEIRLGKPEDSFDTLPILDVSLGPKPVDATVGAIDPVNALEARVEEDPDDPQLRREFAEALIESGDRTRGLDELDVALQRFEVLQDWAHAAAVSEEVLRLEPNSVNHHQKRVEYAYRLGEKQTLVQAYMDLGNAFFRSGSVDRAQAIYQRVLEHDADNAPARDALANLMPAEKVVPPKHVEPAATARKSDAYVDLGEFIMGEESDRDTRMRVEQNAPTGDEQQDFADMLQQFKRGIEENIDDEDSQAHYDLGVAFKEMGLLDEAIGEFQKALRGPDTRLQSAEMLGLCFIEKKQFEVAATVLRRAIESDPSSEQDKVNVLYWLGRCEEEKSRMGEALSYYRRVFAVDIHFEDVGQRIGALKAPGG